MARSVQVFAYSPVWLALHFGSAAVLLAVGLAGTCLSRRIIMPDMLDYVTSMTYHNHFITLPGDAGGELDAMERARIHCSLPVSVRDAQGEAEVGCVAFTMSNGLRSLEKGRMFV